MPKKASVTKEMIISVAIDIVQKGESLNVRAVANKLGCSIQPVFYNFATMDELKKEIDARMVKIYDEYVENCVKNSKFPPYKAIGMAYIGFARDYPEFFKQMFMDENGNKIISSDNATFLSAIDSVCKIFGCDKQTAMRFHLEMWVFVHGFATMVATKYIEWDEESVSDMVTDVFEGVKLRLNLKPQTA